MPFNEYKQLVLEHYGNDSKEFIIASLYDQVPCRDNLGTLKIVGNMKDTTLNDKMNCIVIPRVPTVGTVVLNVYKTSTKYETLKYKLNSELTNMLRDYISKNTFADDILFKTARHKGDVVKLSGFLSK